LWRSCQWTVNVTRLIRPSTRATPHGSPCRGFIGDGLRDALGPSPACRAVVPGESRSCADLGGDRRAGRVVEAGTVEDIFYIRRMPCTLGLLGSQPRLDERRQRLHPISGAPLVMIDMTLPRPTHTVACHFPAVVALSGLSGVNGAGQP
jgi:hypothetical protein